MSDDARRAPTVSPAASAALKRRRAAKLAGRASDDDDGDDDYPHSPPPHSLSPLARFASPPPVSPPPGAWVPPARNARPRTHARKAPGGVASPTSPMSPVAAGSPYPPASLLSASLDNLALASGDSGDDASDDPDYEADDADALNAAVADAMQGARPTRATRARSPDNEVFNEAELGAAALDAQGQPVQPVARVEYVETRDEVYCRERNYPNPEDRLKFPCWLCLAGDIGIATSKNAYLRKLNRIIDCNYGFVSNWELADSVADVYKRQIQPALAARNVKTIDLPTWKVKEHIETHSLNPRFQLGEAIRFTVETATKMRKERDNDTGQVTPALKNIKAHADAIKQLVELYRIDQSKLAFYVPPDKD